jgi:hypothetical protein
VIVARLPSRLEKGKRRNIVLNSSDRGGTVYVRNLNLSPEEYVAIKKAFLKEALRRSQTPLSAKKIVEEIECLK